MRTLLLFVLVYVGLLFLADPLGMLCCCAELWGNALHALCNASWSVFKAFLAGLDFTSTEIYKDFVFYRNSMLKQLHEQLEDEFSYSSILMYGIKCLFFAYFNPFNILRNSLEWGGTAVVSLRPFTLPQFKRTAVGRYLADTGATHHLSYRLLPSDSIVSRQAVSTALGGSGSVSLTRQENCIADGPPKGDELLSVGMIAERGGGFHMTADGAWFEHPSLPKPIQCTVEHRTPYLTMDQYDTLRSLPAAVKAQRLQPATETLHWDYPAALSLVLLGVSDPDFDYYGSWFSRSYLVQWAPCVLRKAWISAEKSPEVFLRILSEVSMSFQHDLSGGGPSPEDDEPCPQVMFMQKLSIKAPKRFPLARNGAHQSGTTAAGNAPAQDPGGSVDPGAPEFTLIEAKDVKELSDELRCSDDIANARRKGPMRYDDQARLTALLEKGRPLVCADVCFPQHNSFSHSCIWVFEILMLDSMDVGGDQILRLVLPMPARSESFEDLKPLLLTIRYKLKSMEGGFEFKTEAERATKHAAFISWCSDHGIITAKSQDFRHPSFEVAVGHCERSLRKLHHSQSVPGATVWAASCMYLLFRALRDAAPAFGCKVSFGHSFPRDLFGRLSFSPKPGEKNSVVEPNGAPLVLLYPKWQSNHTVVGLVHSGTSHQGLKLAEFLWPEIKVTRALCFDRSISSTLAIRHYLRQPFKTSVIRKTVLPKHVDCAACVRERRENDEQVQGRGRPPKHTCNDTCCYMQQLTFLDPEFVLTCDRTSQGEAAAEIACQAAQFGVTAISSHLTEESADSARPAVHDGGVPSPTFRRLVTERNDLQETLSESIELRRMAEIDMLPPDVGAVVLRQMQVPLRKELFEAAETESNPSARAQRIKNGTKSANIVKVYTVSTKQREPAFYAVTLRPSEEAKKCETDKQLLADIHESGNRELSNLLERGTLELLPISEVKPGDVVLPSLVVLTRKRDGRLKTRLVGCGNYDSSLEVSDVYSSTADQNYWRLLLTLTVLMSWTAVGIDVSEAFTQSDAKDTSASHKSYVRMPSQWRGILCPPILREKGVTPENWQRWVLRIAGWLYGERGAPKAWRQTLIKYLLSLTSEGFKFVQSQYDPDVLFVVSTVSMVIIVLFVDDLWLFAQRFKDAQLIIELLRKRFRCTEPDYLCGNESGKPFVRATTLRDAPTFCAVSVYFRLVGDRLMLVLSQIEFLEGAFIKLVDKGVIEENDLLRPLYSLDAKAFAYDYLSEANDTDNPRLSKADLTHLRSAVNTISYAALRTRPELLPALGSCARGQSESTGRKRFLTAARLMLRYAYATRKREINIDTGMRGDAMESIPSRPLADTTGTVFQLSATFDASLGCAGRSLDGYARQGCNLFCSVNSSPDGLISSKSGLQSTISLSTTDSELTSGTACAREVVGVGNFLKEVYAGAVFPAATLWGDCQAANSIGGGLANTRRVRHLSLSALWVRQVTLEGRVVLKYVRTSENSADLLTKVLDRQALEKLLPLLGIWTTN